jgi:hypothetical protein
MPAPRFESQTPLLTRSPAAKLALTGMFPVLVLLALGPFIPTSAFLSFMTPSVASDSQGPFWAGDLDARRAADLAAEPAEPARSNSYTSGFDPAAAGLVPLRPVQEPGRSAQARDLREPIKTAAQPQPRPAALKPVPVADTNADRSQKPSKGFFGFTPQLPSATQLLSPFTFVSDKVSSLFKRS